MEAVVVVLAGSQEAVIAYRQQSGDRLVGFNLL